jgi:hypothetical protein
LASATALTFGKGRLGSGFTGVTGLLTDLDLREEGFFTGVTLVFRSVARQLAFASANPLYD